MKTMKESLKKLMAMLPDDADGAIITSDLNRRYLTDKIGRASCRERV